MKNLTFKLGQKLQYNQKFEVNPLHLSFKEQSKLEQYKIEEHPYQTVEELANRVIKILL